MSKTVTHTLEFESSNNNSVIDTTITNNTTGKSSTSSKESSPSASSVSSNTDLSKSKVALPSIDHILKTIDVYQNQQKLHDSQLLLEFNQRETSRLSVDRSSNRTAVDTLDSPTPTSTTTTPLLHQNPYPNNQQQKNSLHNDENESQERFNNDTNEYSFNSIKSQQTNIGLTFKAEDPSIPTRRKRSSSTTPLPNQEHHQSSTQLNLSTTPQYETPSRHSSVESIDSSSQSGANTPNSTSSNNINNKKRTNLPRETIEILNEWILKNMDNPYPNHTQKRILLDKTGLSNVQLSNWFINKRRRRIFSNLSGNNGQPIKKKRLIDRI